MKIRLLAPTDAAVFQALRLAGLREVPSAFGSSYEEEKDLPAAMIEERLAARPDRGTIGAFEGATLVGVTGVYRQSHRKLSHKAAIWGMYVVPRSREQGVGRALLLEAVALARSFPGVVQVGLTVNASNTSALRLYESVGFVAWGREPASMLIDGELYDEIHMSLQLVDR